MNDPEVVKINIPSKRNCELTLDEVEGLMQFLINEFIAHDNESAKAAIHKMQDYLDSFNNG